MGSKEDLEPRQIQGSRKQLSQWSRQGLGHPEGVPTWSHFGPVWSRVHYGQGSAGHLGLCPSEISHSGEVIPQK